MGHCIWDQPGRLTNQPPPECVPNRTFGLPILREKVIYWVYSSTRSRFYFNSTTTKKIVLVRNVTGRHQYIHKCLSHLATAKTSCQQGCCNLYPYLYDRGHTSPLILSQSAILSRDNHHINCHWSFIQIKPPSKSTFETAEHLFHYVLRYYDLPEVIVSDRPLNLHQGFGQISSDYLTSIYVSLQVTMTSLMSRLNIYIKNSPNTFAYTVNRTNPTRDAFFPRIWLSAKLNPQTFYKMNSLSVCSGVPMCSK